METGKNHIDQEEIRHRLSNAGLKVTPQRMAIFKEVYERCDHPSADKVFEAVSPLQPAMSLGTVYKTLDTLVNVGLLARVATDEGLLRYDANPVQHHHIFMKDSGEIIDFHDEELVGIIRKHLESKNLKDLEIENIHLQITGRKAVSGTEKDG